LNSRSKLRLGFPCKANISKRFIIDLLHWLPIRDSLLENILFR
jgi:hypothetical protein